MTYLMLLAAYLLLVLLALMQNRINARHEEEEDTRGDHW